MWLGSLAAVTSAIEAEASRQDRYGMPATPRPMSPAPIRKKARAPRLV